MCVCGAGLRTCPPQTPYDRSRTFRSESAMPRALPSLVAAAVAIAAAVIAAQQPANTAQQPGSTAPQPNPRQQPGAAITVFAPEQHDLYDGHFVLSAGRIHMVGGLNDAPGWDHMDN